MKKAKVPLRNDLIFSVTQFCNELETLDLIKTTQANEESSVFPYHFFELSQQSAIAHQ